ncbi:acyl-CoA thioesterase YbgC [Candidatus Phycosocius bacilliformis]|uniref:Acyl-CoA thioesterase YbgC n=1 Tax=Candidatus Phycosocius bacilliformis TaxID=1445552 RepID=A0A2P2EAD7_9PROT|nr:YbgC/FadM family acyl-CoA thioesterase [Candidatus Phycosocius bacilliformis]GBF58005.1 acyl-CoA thioesterase YbgC [Candidatus Phycosocius bacilliformis]
MQDLPTAGRFDGRTHYLPVRIYYEDTDMSGIVYHANYLRYFERARSDFLRLAGIHHSLLLARDPPLAFAITSMDIKFKKAARIDDALVVRTHYDAIQGVRLIISQTIFRGAEVIATAAVEAVTIDLDGRPRRPFKELAEQLGPYLKPADSQAG